MSTQTSKSILFTHTQPQQGFRLLEIPPDLEELLTSKDAPVLQLKSPSSALAQAVKDPAALEYVNLCTPTKTYRIRQVQSSNSIHILQPSLGQISRDDIKVVEEEAGDSGALNIPDEAVTTIAKCGSTLELHIPDGGFSATPFLEKSLRLYDPRSGDYEGDLAMEDENITETRKREAREQVCEDIPVSAAQCEMAWLDICAFVDSSQEVSCWRPSARMRLSVWKRLVEGALLQGIDLEKQFLVGDLWKSVLDDDASAPPFPRPLLEALARRLCAEDQRPSLSEDIKWASFDKTECTRWVGETCLAATAPTASSAVGRGEFLQLWKDCLPESWRDDATLSKLSAGSFESPNPTTIFFVDTSQRTQASHAPVAGTGAAKPKTKTTRNWHELLKNQKR
ncbi:hypothetical protein VI817_006838 [Penicillium citrinum]|uniref:Sister chromatid cohesion protein Dcc1 n=1 Tax=Penicillium hetheringtonii TaxID=911720 RepID=A0AAD6GKB5_9EURO|nr:hypothetical protein N7450_010737 [Penicillium hetheringtonii]KAK5791529.1 hypothetical protein VI817_006838 [Penicillium citrinum]